MKKDRDCNNMGMYPNMMQYGMPYNMGMYPNMMMPNMIPMPTINNDFNNGFNNSLESQITNLNNRINMLEKRVTKLEGSNNATTYDSNYYMV